MDFYKRMIIKILERSVAAEDSRVLKKLREGYDLSAKDRKELEELIDSL